ncbi:hypothetical protein [Streptomyces sp. BE303]|uniref:hypothetical protein n=1 Tax=Streptomycetaceae TaxID=2062 RepID=UPI002E7A7F25|nr:hypothetical protein [Streptomyces sp. BE303]MED7952568.1 hypothetical protein [Streptomyces sp. BE303]
MDQQADVRPESGTAVEEVVERILRVPDGYRGFTTPQAALQKVYGVPGELLELLLDAGLPHRGSGDERRFDVFDLENVTVELELNSPSWMLMRTLGRAFDGGLGRSRNEYRFRTTGRCPEPGHSGACDFAPGSMLDAATGSGEVTWDGPASFVRQITLPDEEYWFDDSVLPLFASVDRLFFHLLPHALSTDVGFARETGLADCRLAGHVLLDEAGGTGVRVRGASGLIMSAPFPLQHMWVEVEVDGRWTAADPFFLRTLARWRIVDSRAWPAHRSPRRIYWAVEGAPAPQDIAMITHRGERASSSSRMVDWQD